MSHHIIMLPCAPSVYYHKKTILFQSQAKKKKYLRWSILQPAIADLLKRGLFSPSEAIHDRGDNQSQVSIAAIFWAPSQ